MISLKKGTAMYRKSTLLCVTQGTAIPNPKAGTDTFDSDDVILSEKGLDQARNLRGALSQVLTLSGLPLDFIMCSRLSASRQTAMIGTGRDPTTEQQALSNHSPIKTNALYVQRQDPSSLQLIHDAFGEIRAQGEDLRFVDYMTGGVHSTNSISAQNLKVLGHWAECAWVDILHALLRDPDRRTGLLIGYPCLLQAMLLAASPAHPVLYDTVPAPCTGFIISLEGCTVKRIDRFS